MAILVSRKGNINHRPTIKVSDGNYFMFKGNSLWYQGDTHWMEFRYSKSIAGEKKKIYKLLQDVVNRIS